MRSLALRLFLSRFWDSQETILWQNFGRQTSVTVAAPHQMQLAALRFRPLKCTAKQLIAISFSPQINLGPYLEPQPVPQFQSFRSPLTPLFSKYHPFSAFGLSRSASSLMENDPSEAAYYNNQNQNQHQKRQTMKYHQCYFNPISCFRRRR